MSIPSAFPLTGGFCLPGNSVESTGRWTRASLIAPLLILAACGGGGSNPTSSSDSSASSSTPDTVPPPTSSATSPQPAGTPQSNTGTASPASPGSTIQPSNPPAFSDWSTPTAIQAALSHTNNRSPDVAVDTYGNAIAIWAHAESNTTRILSRRYAIGSGWGSVVPINNSNSVDAWGPKMAFDRQGNALAVWLETDENYMGAYDSERPAVFVWANRYSAVTGWGTAEAIARRGLWLVDDHLNRPEPLITMGANGNATVVWYSSGSVNSIHYIAGVGWGQKELIGGGGQLYAATPNIAGNAAGDVVAMWWQAVTGGGELWSNRYTPATGWRIPTRVSSNIRPIDAAPGLAPSIAMDGNGNVSAIWIQGVADPICIRVNMWTSRFAVDQSWAAAQTLDSSPGDCNSGNGLYKIPAIAMDANGNALATWAKQEGTAQIYCGLDIRQTPDGSRQRFSQHTIPTSSPPPWSRRILLAIPLQ
jgi:hypothetical protein